MYQKDINFETKSYTSNDNYLSDDQYTRRTRPMILRKMFYSCIGFCFFAPMIIIITSKLSMEKEIMFIFVDVIKYIGTLLFGAFGTGFLGYTASRTIDKKNPDFKNEEGIKNKIVNKFLKI